MLSSPHRVGVIGCGVILDLGVHMLDVARYLMGEATRVYCQTQSVKPGIAGEDMATIVLRHAGGATSMVECSYASKIHPDLFPQAIASDRRDCRELTCDRFGFLKRVFLLSDGHRLVGRQRRARLKPRRTFGWPNLPRPRRTSPVVFIGTHDAERLMRLTRVAAAAIPRSTAGCRRRGFWGSRPRPSGRRHSGRG